MRQIWKARAIRLHVMCVRYARLGQAMGWRSLGAWGLFITHNSFIAKHRPVDYVYHNVYRIPTLLTRTLAGGGTP